MRVLLRSTFIAQASDSPDLFLRNYFALVDSGLGFNIPEDTAIWGYVQGFVRSHQHCPKITTIRHHFERTSEMEVVDRLEGLAQVTPIIKGDFLRYLEDKADDRRTRLVAEFLKEAGNILTTGATIKEGREERKLLGPRDAIQWLIRRGHDIVTPTTGVRLSGDVTHDGKDFLDEYERIKNDPLAGIGQYTGIQQLDQSIRGAKRHELWLHAAFTGGLKCVAGDTRVFDLATGCLSTVLELYEAGNAPLVHALDEKSWKIVQAQASPVVQNGVRQILKVSTETGRSIRVSGNHPFMTLTGWVNTEDLYVGDWVAIPVDIPGATKEAKDVLGLRNKPVWRGPPKQGQVFWEQVVGIIPDGEEMTYDLSVPGPENFVANGFITHNSTFMLNWAYNQAIYFKHDVLIYSLEMPYPQCRRLIYALHSCHPKFSSIHPPLDYLKTRDGELTSKEEWFLREHVVPDMNSDPEYGKIIVEVADPDKIDFTVADIRSRAELVYSETPFSAIFIDHALLISPRKWHRSTTENINEVIRDCKKMSMSFNRGMGMAVILLFQISREGYKAAKKAREGDSNYVYNLTMLSYANEAERSSDIVTSTWLDESLSKRGRVLFQCLKSRDQKPFEPFQAGIYWPCRRLRTLKDAEIDDVTSVGDEIDDLADID